MMISKISVKNDRDVPDDFLWRALVSEWVFKLKTGSRGVR